MDSEKTLKEDVTKDLEVSEFGVIEKKQAVSFEDVLYTLKKEVIIGMFVDMKEKVGNFIAHFPPAFRKGIDDWWKDRDQNPKFPPFITEDGPTLHPMDVYHGMEVDKPSQK